MKLASFGWLQTRSMAGVCFNQSSYAGRRKPKSRNSVRNLQKPNILDMKYDSSKVEKKTYLEVVQSSILSKEVEKINLC